MTLLNSKEAAAKILLGALVLIATYDRLRGRRRG